MHLPWFSVLPPIIVNANRMNYQLLNQCEIWLKASPTASSHPLTLYDLLLCHSFGIQHDGNGNDCEPIGKRPFIMSPQLLYGNSPPNWSRCSREYITRFLE